MLKLRIKNIEGFNDTIHGIQFKDSISVNNIEELFKTIFLDMDIEIYDDAKKEYNFTKRKTQ